MRCEEVLAVVVSYNGLQKTRETVDALRGQVGHVHIVDNGSEAPSLEVLAALAHQPGVSVERLPENRGIGHALNLGVNRARDRGYPWLLTMDQDSLVDSAMVRAYQAAIEEDPTRMCLAPTRLGGQQSGGVVGYAITSGNLVHVSLFDQIGLYDEGLFIDCIDFDFSLRVRRAGHSVYRVPNAVMRHRLGDADDGGHHLVKRYYALHSPTRRYYMYRNFMYIVERYARDFPLFILKLALAQALLTVLVGFFDPRPMESYRAIGRGMKDYFARKQGPYMQPAR